MECLTLTKVSGRLSSSGLCLYRFTIVGMQVSSVVLILRLFGTDRFNVMWKAMYDANVASSITKDNTNTGKSIHIIWIPILFVFLLTVFHKLSETTLFSPRYSNLCLILTFLMRKHDSNYTFQYMRCVVSRDGRQLFAGRCDCKTKFRMCTSDELQ